jgi:CheY-like chemotaxis protein
MKDKKDKILVVDDEEMILALLKRILSEAGFSVYSASSGKEALKIVKQKKDIWVYFLDLQMPKMDGIELCREIRKINPIACIFAITAYSSIYTLAECREAGFDDYFIKPFNNATLIAATHYAFVKLERWQKEIKS